MPESAGRQQAVEGRWVYEERKESGNLCDWPY